MGGAWLAGALIDVLAAYSFADPVIDGGPGFGPATLAGAAVMCLAISAIVVVRLAFRLARRATTHDRAGRVLLVIGMASLAAARTFAVGADASMMKTIGEAVAGGIVGVEGVVTAGRLVDRPGRDPEAVRWLLDLVVEAGDLPSLAGRRLQIEVARPPLVDPIGCRIRATGTWRPWVRGRNPGEARPHVSIGRVPGTLRVPDPGLMEIVEDSTVHVSRWMTAWRNGWTAAARRVEDRVFAEGHRSGLVPAMVAGDRSRLDPMLRSAAVRAGLAHVLAISGLHLVVVATLVAALVGRRQAWSGIVVVIGMVVFGFLVTSTASVVRAVATAVVGGTLLCVGRAVRGPSILGVVLAGMTWIDPFIVGRVGFQLTMAATTAIVWSSSAVERRWFDRRDLIGTTRRSTVVGRLRSVAAICLVTWIATAPITLGRFGTLSLISVPGTMAVLPILPWLLGSALTATGLEMVRPGLALHPIDLVVRWSFGGFESVVEGASCLVDPLSTTTTDLGSVIAFPTAVATAVLLGVAGDLRRRLGLVAVVVATTIAASPINGDVEPRVRMIDVGDGTCILVRNGRSAVLFDAGSNGRPEVGVRTIVPALRRVGIRRLDAIVVSHANTDHFQAVPGIVESMAVDLVVVGEPLLVASRSGDRPDLVEWLRRLERSEVEIRSVGRGDRGDWAGLDWTVLHPRRGEPNRTVNDGSLVLRVEAPDSMGGSLLLCGDIQDEGIARLLSREPGLAASVLELPHHGSWRPIAAELVHRVDPRAVIQSTGARRWRHDRFGPACFGRRRFVTARDGSFVLEFSAFGPTDGGSVQKKRRPAS